MGDQADDDALAELFDKMSEDLEDALKAGGEVDCEAVATKYQTSVENVKVCLEALTALAGVVSAPKEVKPDFLGPYEIKEELGRGGMGVVYRAYHPKLERDVAIKISKFGEQATESQRQRFLIEGRVVAKLRHPNIVAIHDVGIDQGTHYQVMDWIQGSSLHSVLKRDGRQDPEHSARIIRKLASALDHAHHRSIVHRDVKPRNVMMTPAGEPILMDFGLAKDVAAKSQTLTHTGQFIGTLRYASPEQVRGEKHSIDQRTDIYHLGATLYHMIVGLAPFSDLTETKTTDAICQQKPDLSGFLVDATDLTIALKEICERCLEKEQKDRYQSADELISDLDRALAGDWNPKTQESVALDATQPGAICREHPVIFLLGVSFGFILGLGLGAWLF